MTLEDQIRRMGDARAAEVNTPSWRDRIGTRRRWPLLVAAAAAMAFALGVTVALLPSDEPDTEVVDSPTTTQAATSTTESVQSSTTVTTTTSDPATTTTPLAQTGICAANPVPTDDVLDIATHISANRTPLDLDQDGVPDEMLVYDDADGNWWLIARLQTGWTNALEVGGSMLPTLVPTPGGDAAASDLDGDGGLEFFLDRYEIGWAVGLTSLQGCSLVDSFTQETPDETGSAFDDLGGTFGVLTKPIESDECGSGCPVRASCRDNVLIQEVVLDFASPTDANWGWSISEIRMVDGTITVSELPARTGSPLTTPLPDDAPRPEDAGVIDCTP